MVGVAQSHHLEQLRRRVRREDLETLMRALPLLEPRTQAHAHALAAAHGRGEPKGRRGGGWGTVGLHTTMLRRRDVAKLPHSHTATLVYYTDTMRIGAPRRSGRWFRLAALSSIILVYYNHNHTNYYQTGLTGTKRIVRSGEAAVGGDSQHVAVSY